MKGTIDASLANASKSILNDPKETAEHSTIVDLIRNDLSQICSKVEVERFRYLSHVEGHDKNLIQVSSSIKGKLNEGYIDRLGTDFFSLLPAGSITGAPKKRTVEIIKKVELSDRGYYTGVCGYFDGHNLDSGIMIRMITAHNEVYQYHSGGGITYQSEIQSEYDELLNKIYVPINRDHTHKQRRNPKYKLS
jgi:para-aminobenzoate synthetase component 1